MGKLRVILSILGILLYTIPLYAQQETRVKLGYASIACEPVSESPVIEASYQYRPDWLKWLAIEPAITGMSSNITEVGRMYIVEPSLTGKVYIHNLYIGGGVGYYFNTITSDHNTKTDLDDEWVRFGVVGLEFKEMFIELKACVADLDLETGLPFETDIEKHSRYDNFQVLVGKRFKF